MEIGFVLSTAIVTLKDVLQTIFLWCKNVWLRSFVDERHALIPQLCVLFVLAGVVGPKFVANSQSVYDTSATLAGNRLSFFSCFSACFVMLFGVGLASGATVDPAWAAANEVSAGALVVAGFEPLGAFGHFCAVIVGLGLINNNIPGTYSAALAFQL
ncbi:hypothetical protein PV05_02604 [Exophiala xenobiotica]|uniref:Uncharacterized protein n=1 Tax=Exophiala xenobiotica TaxID=348802 RepID=A0A0D2FDE0_9EURO|nr:uncharacterized protein PV05_02604 [Exophiala xenobiotica]KIW58054.1 hypothetical protein PV05_02604 [Exophiala xenobiotica]